MASSRSVKVALLGSGLVALAVAALIFRGGRTAPAPESPSEAPPGWELAGSRIEDYEVSLDPNGGRRGGSALRIASIVEEAPGYGGVARQVDPAPFRGRRLTLSASVRAEDVTGKAGLWLRIDTPDRRSWALDNMLERPIRGTQGWQAYKVSLDVPQHASDLYYGAIVFGRGTVWLDDVVLREATSAEPSTEPGWSRLRRRGLDFE